MNLKSNQRKYLRGLAHKLKPVVFIGQKGVTTAVAKAIDEALDTHELIKVKFIDFKEKDHKTALTARIESNNGAALAGLIGHTAIFYRPHPDSEKRRIHLPEG